MVGLGIRGSTNQHWHKKDQTMNIDLEDQKTRARFRIAGLSSLLFLTVAVAPAAAQTQFCSQPLVSTLGNVLGAATTIGPILGLISGVVAFVMQGVSTGKEGKKKWKERRNNAFIYGVGGVLLAGVIAKFIFNVLGMNGCWNQLGL